MLVGERVVALCDIEEGGNFDVHVPPSRHEGNIRVEGGDRIWVHARAGDQGVVTYVNEDGIPTVRFDRTGTATIVAAIQGVEGVEVAPLFD